MQALRLSIITCAILSLTGCTQITQQLPTLTHEARATHFSNMQKWSVNAKVAVRTKDDGENLNMHWQQNGAKYNIRFYSPFSTDAATLSGDATLAKLEMSDGEIYKDSDPNGLLQQHLGWSLPFSRLSYWIKGQVAPQSTPTDTKFDKYNQLQSLQQDGWLIEYQEYRVMHGCTLPGKIALQKDGTTIKLYINDWKK